MKKGTLAALKAACRKMRVGTELYFELTEEPQRYQLALMAAELSSEDKTYSFLRNGKVVHVSCYVPFSRSRT